MEIRHLKLVKAIVEEGSIANTIDRLHLTASALSYQLKEAEQQLGTPIFLRVNKKMILTAAGQQVYLSANRILKELEQMTDAVDEVLTGKAGMIRVSIQYHTTYHWLPPLIQQFQEAFPNIEVKVVFAESGAQLDKLLAGEIDIVLTCMQTLPKQLVYTTLFKDEMVALVPDTAAWAGKPFVIAEDFRDVNLIVHSTPEHTDVLYADILQPSGITPENITVLPLTDAAVAMIRSGLGVSVMTKSAVKPALLSEGIRVLPVTDRGLYKYQYAATLRNAQMPSYMDHFIRFLKFDV